MANLLFDYDGTLHDCATIYCPAFRLAYETLVQRGLASERVWQDREISRWLGYSARDMWDSFAPELSQSEKNRCSALIGEEMLRLTREGRARLYPGVPEMLNRLKLCEHRLILLSNCKITYLKAHREQFHLNRWFDDFFCTEQFDWQPKTEIFPMIQQRCSGNFIVIGDRFHDMEIARQFQLRSIGCRYGYGAIEELSDADRIAEVPGEISELVNQILEE